MGDLGPSPSAAEVAWRYLALLTILRYGAVAMPRLLMADYIAAASPDVRDAFSAEAASYGESVWKPVRENARWWAAFSPKEKAMAEKTIDALDRQQIIDAIWRQESVGVLLWAMGFLPSLHPYDQQFAMEELSVDLKGSVEAFVASVTLRPRAEIEKARDLAELWHWRSRTRELVERTPSHLKAFELDEIVRKVAPMAHQSSDIPAPIDQDFPIRGKAYRDMTDEEWSEVRSITMERHFALNWLCGYARSNQWDETPTDT